MTRKDYELIAAAIKGNRKNAEIVGQPTEYIDDIARDLAGIFADDNPRFDRERFLKACGISE